MEKEIVIASISSIFYFIGIFPYFRDVLSWRTLPHPFSYFVWLVLTGFNSSILILQWEYISFIPAILNTISCLIFTIFGIRAMKKIQINHFDFIFLLSALLLLPFYFYTKDLLLTIILSVVIDFLWYLPTIKKWWLQPWSETLFTFFIIGISQFLIIFAQSEITLVWSLFWMYVFIVNMIFVSLVLCRRYFLRGRKSLFQ